MGRTQGRIRNIHDFATALAEFCKSKDIEHTCAGVESRLLNNSHSERKAAALGCERCLSLEFYAFDHVVAVSVPEIANDKPITKQGVNNIRALDRITFQEDADEFDGDDDGEELTFASYDEALAYFRKLAARLVKNNKQRVRRAEAKESTGPTCVTAALEVMRWHVDADSRIGALRMGDMAVSMFRIDKDWTVVEPTQFLQALGGIVLPDFGSSADLLDVTERITRAAAGYRMHVDGTGEFQREGDVDRFTMRFELDCGERIYLTFNTETIY